MAVIAGAKKRWICRESLSEDTRAAPSMSRLLDRLLPASVVAGALSLGIGGCIEDTDCGICDPNNLVLETIAGTTSPATRSSCCLLRATGPTVPASR
jgi:hypothetical protein